MADASDLIVRARERLAESTFDELLNLEVTELTERECRLSASGIEQLLNPGGVLHGAAISGLLDVAMGLTVLADLGFPQAHASTAQMDIDFLEMVPADSEVTAVGELVRPGNRLFFTRGEIVRADGKLAATSSGIYVPTEWSGD